MSVKPTDFAYHLSRYLGQHLTGRRGVSPNTVQSYRDTFTLLLRFLEAIDHIAPERVTLDTLSPECIETFLDWLETTRGCAVATRNLRLAAVHAFFRYLQVEDPTQLYHCQLILAIPRKRQPQSTIAYLPLEGIQALLACPDRTTRTGRRDLVLISLLYDTGARVQELADLRIEDVRLTAPATIQLTGKGSKTRIVPLMTPTSALLGQYIEEANFRGTQRSLRPLFPGRSGNKLTRAGIAYLLNKYAHQARDQHPEWIPSVLSPHVMRHSKAMHLLQAGVNLIYIRDLLGHVSVTTTEVYARADSEMKRQALEAAYPSAASVTMPIWQDNTELLIWLKSLCK